MLLLATMAIALIEHISPWHGRQCPRRGAGRARAFVSAASSAVSSPLTGTRWKLDLDVGQERGSWMPPAWGLSGDRARLQVVVCFEEGGRLDIGETGVYDGRVCRWDGPAGGWEVSGERAVFWLSHQGLERGDVALEPARLYFSAPCWSAVLSKRGTLTIKQRKLGWLPFIPSLNEGSFIVGTFQAKPHPADAPPLGATL